MRRYIFSLALFHFWTAFWLDGDYADMVLIYEGKEYTAESWYGAPRQLPPGGFCGRE